MDPPSPPQPQPDPLLQQQEQQAQNDLAAALQTQAQGDTASLMARYGTRLALAGSSSGAAVTGSPLFSTALRSPAVMRAA